MLLTKGFTKVIVLSFLLAIPFAWYGMEYWLQAFAYRIRLPIDAFILAGISTILIGWMTIGAPAIKVAYTNPVESLKEE